MKKVVLSFGHGSEPVCVADPGSGAEVDSAGQSFAAVLALSFAARGACVPAPDPQSRAGVASLPELLSAYGIYLWYVAIGLAAAAVMMLQVGQASTVQQVQHVVSTVQDIFRNNRGADKTGLTTALVAASGRLPNNLVEGSDIWVGGGDYPIRLLPGSTSPSAEYDKHGVTGVRYFSVLVGDVDNPLDPDLCADIMLAQYTELVAMSVSDAASQATPTLETFVGTLPTGTATDTHWSIRDSHTDVELLDTVAPASVELACGTETDGEVQVMLAFR